MFKDVQGIMCQCNVLRVQHRHMELTPVIRQLSSSLHTCLCPRPTTLSCSTPLRVSPRCTAPLNHNRVITRASSRTPNSRIPSNRTPHNSPTLAISSRTDIKCTCKICDENILTWIRLGCDETLLLELHCTALCWDYENICTWSVF